MLGMPHPGEEQLLAVGVRLGQADLARPCTYAVGVVAALLVAQPVRAVVGERGDPVGSQMLFGYAEMTTAVGRSA